MLGFIQGVEAKSPAMFIVKFSKWKTIVDSSPRYFLALVILCSSWSQLNIFNIGFRGLVGCIVLEPRENNTFVTGFCFIYLGFSGFVDNPEDLIAKLAMIALLFSKNKNVKGHTAFISMYFKQNLPY